MIKRFLALLLVLVLVAGLTVPIHAYNAKGHNKVIEKILFGKADYAQSISADIHEKLQMLEYATTICLDQYNGHYTDELKFLNDQNIRGIIQQISDIDFSGNSRHRQKTHLGWDYSYSPDDAHWSERKILLLQTVNKTFGFRNIAGQQKILWFTHDFGYDKKCESFSAFLYYLHILGEFEELNEKLNSLSYSRTSYDEIFSDVLPLARMYPADKYPDVFWELEKHLPVIFQTHKENGSRVYINMMQDIQILATEARRFALENNDFDKPSADVVAEYCHYGVKLIEILQNTVPELLKDEEFFASVFYPDEVKKKPWYQFW